MKLKCILILAFLSLFPGGCVQKLTSPKCAARQTSGDSDTQATQRGQGGQSQRCGTILPSVQEVGRPIMRSLVSQGKAITAPPSPKDATSVAKNVAYYSNIMLENMMASGQEPIHPEAFIATVKDFESAASLQWAMVGAGNYFKTRNCTSGECYGLFQVDIRLEKNYESGKICGSGGLNISPFKGSGDFCSFFYWWTSSENGGKCKKISSGSANPCRTKGTPWTLDMVNSGRKSYVQQGQWGENSWREMYGNYKSCLTQKHGTLEKAVAEFKKSLSLSTLPDGPEVEGTPQLAAQTPVDSTQATAPPTSGEASDDCTK